MCVRARVFVCAKPKPGLRHKMDGIKTNGDPPACAQVPVARLNCIIQDTGFDIQSALHKTTGSVNLTLFD